MYYLFFLCFFLFIILPVHAQTDEESKLLDDFTVSNHDRLLMESKIGFRTKFPFSQPYVNDVSSKWVKKVEDYGSFKNIQKEAGNQSFYHNMKILAGISKYAYNDYKASLSFDKMDLNDILEDEGDYTSQNISQIITKTAHKLGYNSVSAMNLDRGSGLPHAITLISESKGGKFVIIYKNKIISTFTKDVEQALEQWSCYTGYNHWLTELYNEKGENIYLDINEFGERIRPSNIGQPQSLEPHIRFKAHDEEIGITFFTQNIGFELGTIRGYSNMEWSPFLRIGINKKYKKFENTPEYYLDTSYFRGGGALYYFYGEDMEGENQDAIALFLELGTEFSFPVFEDSPYEIVVGIDYLNNWGGYYDIVENKFEIESIPSGFLEAKLGLRRNFAFKDLKFHITPYIIGRYSRYRLQSPIPFVYSVYGTHGRFFYPVTSNSNILLDCDFQTTLSHENTYKKWHIEAIYQNLQNLSLKVRYEQKILLYYTSYKSVFEIAFYLQKGLEINLSSQYRFDDQRFAITFGVNFEDV